MKSTSIKESTIEELTAKKKTLRAILFVVGSLIIIYAGYFVIKLVNGTWQANNTLGIVGLATLGVVSSTISIQLSQIEKEIKSRNNTH